MRNPHLRNLVVWLGVIAVSAALWLFAARPRLHFIDAGAFLMLVALAAAALTALLWWEKAGHDGASDDPPHGDEPR